MPMLIGTRLAQLAFSPGAVAVPGENLVRGCGLRAGAGRCRFVAWVGGLAVLVIVGGWGWEYGSGLPVTPSARGMRARNLAWRGDCDNDRGRVQSSAMVLAVRMTKENAKTSGPVTPMTGEAASNNGARAARTTVGPPPALRHDSAPLKASANQVAVRR
jgi:hypothetical protein